MTSFKSFFTMQVIIVVLLAGSFKTASAEIVTGVLDAQSVVNSFNSMSSGTGFHFTHASGGAGAVQLQKDGNYQFADISAYDRRRGDNLSASNSFLYTFCVEPDVTAYATGIAKLNYANGMTKTTGYGNPLTVGAAYLYTMFATYTDPTFYTPNSNALASAIRFLIGNAGANDAGTSWANNIVLQNLANINSQDYWNQIYDPNSYYSEIGNYSVFVMDVKWGATDSQDFLYVANAATPYSPPPPTTATPEPASMLIFGLGLVGVVATRRLRNKK